MQAVADRRAHQLVVGGVVFHLVDAVAVAVVGVQDGPVAVGELTPALGFAAAGDRAELVHLVQAPLAALADQRLDEHRGRRGVVVLQGRNLVGDDMRVWHAANITFFRQPHKRRNISAGGRRRTATASAVAKAGHSWPPPSTVMSTTPRLSAHPAVDVVTGPLVVTAGAPH